MSGRELSTLLARTQSGAVLEGPWHRERAQELAALPGAVVEVFCRVDRETARERYRARPDRHPGHFDGHRTDAELWGEQVTDPVAGGWPVLEVDTTRPVDVSSLAARIREQVTR